MSEQAPTTPNAKELYEAHKKDAQTVKELGELASDEFLVDGVSPSLTQQSRELIASSADSAKRMLRANQTRANEIALANQSTLEPQARAEMEVEAEFNHRYYANSRKINEDRIKDAKSKGYDDLVEGYQGYQQEAEAEIAKAASILGPDKLAEMAKKDMQEDIVNRHQLHTNAARHEEDGIPMTQNFRGEDTPKTIESREFIEDQKLKAKELVDKHQDIIEAQASAEMQEDLSQRRQKAA